MNRKVVYAEKGFYSLSPFAERDLYLRKHPGEKVYFYIELTNWLDSPDKCCYYRRIDSEEEVEIEFEKKSIVHCLSLDFGKDVKILEDKNDVDWMRFNNHYIWISDQVERHDPDLIAVVEKLGDKAPGRSCCALGIRDIGEERYHIFDHFDCSETVVTESELIDFWK